MTKKNKKFNKYRINKSSVGLIGVICFFAFGIYIIFDFLNNSNSNGELLIKEDWLRTTFDVIKDVCVAVGGLLGIELIVSCVHEKNYSNNYIDNIIANDVFSSEYLLDTMTRENKEKLLSNLSKNIYFEDNEQKAEMHKSIIQTLNKENNSDYYFNECKFNIACEIKDGYLIKQIVKEQRIRTYFKNGFKLKKYIISRNTYNKDGETYLEINDCKIDGISISIQNDIIQSHLPVTDSDKKNGYNTKIAQCIKKTINLSYDKDTIIKVKYTTKVKITDRMYTCRVDTPCRKFSLDFHLGSGCENYNLRYAAFGFIDDAKKSLNHSNDSKNVCVSFDEWIYPYDGVAIFISD